MQKYIQTYKYAKICKINFYVLISNRVIRQILSEPFFSSKWYQKHVNALNSQPW